MKDRELKIISGSANPKLAKDICSNLEECSGVVDTTIESFNDEESNIAIKDSVRGCDVFVVQPTSRPANHHIMELCLILDALKRSNCWRVTAVIPYYGYARQDRKMMPQVPISAKLVADFISVAGIDRILTMDLHSGQTQGFFDVPVDNLFASSIFLKQIKNMYDPNEVVVVSPDAGGTERAKAYAKRIGCGMAICYKKRAGAGKIEEMTLIGEVSDKTVIMLDDMVDTAGTLCGASKLVSDAGALDVVAYCTHPVLSGVSVTKIEESAFSKIYVTDTIPLNKFAVVSDKIKVITVAPLLAEAIHCIHHEKANSALFS